MSAAEALASVLAAENAALQALDFTGAAALLGQKRAALAAVAAAPPGREALPRLAVLAEENRRLLERALLVQNRVLGVIARAAAAPALPYYRLGARLRGDRAPAMAVSRRM